jgi:Domain of unknown function (DUF4401)
MNGLIEALRARGVIAADAPAPPEATTHRPWFVALMLGFAGWLAGIFLLAFVFMFLELKSTSAILLLGLLLAGSAWALYFADRSAVFLDQLALALSIAGQCAIGWALLEDVRSGLTISATLLVLQLVVLLVMPNKTARTLAALFATIAWVYTVRFLVRGGQFEDMFDDFDRRPGQSEVWAVPLAWLLTWAPMLLAAGWLTRRENIWMAHGLRVFARPVLTGLLLGLSLGGMATEPFVTLALGVDALGVQVSWMALFPLLSIALAMFSARCAFQLRSYGLLGFAVFAALVHLARFYYLYGTSLMWKSMIMICLGVVTLGVGALIQQRIASYGSAR